MNWVQTLKPSRQCAVARSDPPTAACSRSVQRWTLRHSGLPDGERAVGHARMLLSGIQLDEHCKDWIPANCARE